MSEQRRTKQDIAADLTQRAASLWGAKRAGEARANIEEAAEYVWLIAGHPLDNDDAPLFHPPFGP